MIEAVKADPRMMPTSIASSRNERFGMAESMIFAVTNPGLLAPIRREDSRQPLIVDAPQLRRFVVAVHRRVHEAVTANHREPTSQTP
jgi:hypothetical protein